MQTNPLVSVCIPVFNGEKFLLEALESVKNQSYQNIELIISDDHSADSSIELANEFLKTFENRFKLVANPKKGIGSNWNNCVRNANGKYIKFLFQDDILFSDCISEMVSMAETDQKVGMVYSNRAIIFDPADPAHLAWIEGNGDLNKNWSIPLETGIFSGSRLLKDKNLFLKKPFNKIGEPTAILFKKEVFKQVGFFDTELIQFLDLEFSLRVLSGFKFGYINKELAAFRLHENQASNHYALGKRNETALFFQKIKPIVLLKLAWDSKKILLKEKLPGPMIRAVKKVSSYLS